VALVAPSSEQKKEASEECNTTVRVIRDQGGRKNYGLQEWGIYSGMQKILKHIEELHDLCSFPNVIVSVMAPRRRR
jgi:hypothetical protein